MKNETMKRKIHSSKFSKVHVQISDETILPLAIPQNAGLKHLGCLTHLVKNNGDDDILKSFMREFPDLEADEAIRIIALFLLYERSHNHSKPIILNRILRAFYGIE